MKAMEIDSSQWTDEMRQNAVKKLKELGYKEWVIGRVLFNPNGKVRIITWSEGDYHLDDFGTTELQSLRTKHTYEELMSLTKEDVQ